jgi:SAM-dependent methyltransferase
VPSNSQAITFESGLIVSTTTALVETGAGFQAYKRPFVEASRKVLRAEQSPALSEAAFPAYANPNPLISFLFWQRIRRAIHFLAKRGKYNAVLDFGCGGGVMLPFLASVSQRVVGMDIDLSPHKKLAAHVGFPENVEVHDAKERSLRSWSSGTFDVVTALDVLEHVPNLEETVSELERVLAPGGVLIASGPTENILYRIGRKIAGRDYSGAYHVRNIYDIEAVLASVIKLRTLATLYYPLPLFRIYIGERPKALT